MDLTALTTTLRTNLGYETARPPTGSEKQIRLLGRLPQSRMGDWLLFIHHIHVSWIEKRRSLWTVDISKLYFPLPSDKRVVFGWRLIFQPQGTEEPMSQHLDDIVKAIRSCPKTSRSDVMSIPLVGSRAGMPRSENGKGAGLTDKTPVGPMALQQRGR